MRHCADQPLTLKWACFSSGEQFPTGEAGKRPLSTQPISTYSYPPQGSLQGHGSPSGSEMAQETMAGSGDRLNPESRRQALPVAVFRAPQACSLSPPPPLPLQHLPNYRAGLGLACKPSSGFLAAWLFQSQPCRSSTAYTEAASLGGAELGASR